LKALIIGVSGQDGAYLAELLLRQGYEVLGTSRDASTRQFDGLERLGIRDKVRLTSLAPNDFRSVITTISSFAPDEVYNLAGQSSVGLSFDQPIETMESIAVATLNVLEAIRLNRRRVRFYNAGSGECFGDTTGAPADELTPFMPRSPYAVAKAAAHYYVVNYREAYGLFACNGILFNHESPLRPARFVTRKIISAACRIAEGSEETLRLGNLRVRRDWGWAPEYVDAMWRMLRRDDPGDFVIATGESHSLEEFVERAFREVGRDPAEHVVVDETLYRPTDITNGVANPSKARAVLGWTARTTMGGVVAQMVAAERTAMREAARSPLSTRRR
jgi:GDPmannose 4,6-dehydratase